MAIGEPQVSSTSEATRRSDDRASSPARAEVAPRRRVLRAALGIALGVKIVLVGLWFRGSLAGATAQQPSAGELKPPLATARMDASAGMGAGAPAAPAGMGAGAPAAPAGTGAGVPAAPDAASANRPTQSAAIAPMGSEPRADAAKGGQLKALLDSVSRRQAELDQRERDVAGREERLQIYEKDVTAKVATLEDLEKRLSTKVKAASAAGDAAAESMAKVYGAMEASKAAPLLEHLDDATLLRILAHMKEKQLGEILPLMSRDKAVMLTHALADRRL